mgnify:CR=1 FL=1
MRRPKVFPWGVCTGFCSVPAVTIRLRWMLGLQKPCMDADCDACPAARKRRLDFQLGERVLIGCGFIMIVNGWSIGKGAYLYPNRCVDQIEAATTLWALVGAMAVRALGRAHAGGRGGRADARGRGGRERRGAGVGRATTRVEDEAARMRRRPYRPGAGAPAGVTTRGATGGRVNTRGSSGATWRGGGDSREISAARVIRRVGVRRSRHLDDETRAAVQIVIITRPPRRIRFRPSLGRTFVFAIC